MNINCRIHYTKTAVVEFETFAVCTYRHKNYLTTYWSAPKRTVEVIKCIKQEVIRKAYEDFPEAIHTCAICSTRI